MSKNKLQTYFKKTLIQISVCILLMSCSISNSRENKKFVNPVEYPNLVDQSWLTIDKSCSAPCWQGLELGKSSQTEALTLFQTFTFVGHGKELDNAPGNFIFPCIMPSEENCLSMRFENGVLSSLRLYLNSVNHRFD